MVNFQNLKGQDRAHNIHYRVNRADFVKMDFFDLNRMHPGFNLPETAKNRSAVVFNPVGQTAGGDQSQDVGQRTRGCWKEGSITTLSLTAAIEERLTISDERL